jgi:hypothetical protein
MRTMAGKNQSGAVVVLRSNEKRATPFRVLITRPRDESPSSEKSRGGGRAGHCDQRNTKRQKQYSTHLSPSRTQTQRDCRTPFDLSWLGLADTQFDQRRSVPTSDQWHDTDPRP